MSRGLRRSFVHHGGRKSGASWRGSASFHASQLSYVVFDLGEQGGRLCQREQFGNICAGKKIPSVDQENGQQGREVQTKIKKMIDKNIKEMFGIHHITYFSPARNQLYWILIDRARVMKAWIPTPSTPKV